MGNHEQLPGSEAQSNLVAWVLGAEGEQLADKGSGIDYSRVRAVIQVRSGRSLRPA